MRKDFRERREERTCQWQSNIHWVRFGFLPSPHRPGKSRNQTLTALRSRSWYTRSDLHKMGKEGIAGQYKRKRVKHWCKFSAAKWFVDERPQLSPKSQITACQSRLRSSTNKNSNEVRVLTPAIIWSGKEDYHFVGEVGIALEAFLKKGNGLPVCFPMTHDFLLLWHLNTRNLGSKTRNVAKKQNSIPAFQQCTKRPGTSIAKKLKHKNFNYLPKKKSTCFPAWMEP
jgi:hypothetical protein